MQMPLIMTRICIQNHVSSIQPLLHAKSRLELGANNRLSFNMPGGTHGRGEGGWHMQAIHPPITALWKRQKEASS
jgi:hypothetical protein